MMDLQELKSETRFIDSCPVLVTGEFDNVYTCNEKLLVMHTHTIVGDDYGSWPEDSFYFVCGHSFEDMKKSARYADQI